MCATVTSAWLSGIADLNYLHRWTAAACAFFATICACFYQFLTYGAISFCMRRLVWPLYNMEFPSGKSAVREIMLSERSYCRVTNSTCLIVIIIERCARQTVDRSFCRRSINLLEVYHVCWRSSVVTRRQKAPKGSTAVAWLRNDIVTSFPSSTMDFNFATIASGPMLYKCLVRDFT